MTHNFNDVDNKFVQAFNRLKVATNIMQQHGSVKSQKYIEQFSDFDRARMMAVAMDIKKRGRDAVARDVQLSINIDEGWVDGVIHG